MRKKFSSTLWLALCALFLLFAGTAFNALFRNRDWQRVDFSRGAIATLEPETKKALAALQGPVKVTYYTSEKKRMPTPMRTIENDVRSLLREMARRGGKNFVYEVVYPEDVPQVARTLGRFRISSFQYKTILKDEYSVNTVWSGLLIEYKGQTRTVPYITRDHLPYLEDKIMTHLHHIETGYKPFVAVAAPGDCQGLKSLAGVLDMGEVRSFAFGKDGGLPQEADAVFVQQPENLTKKDLEDIKIFLRDGKDVFISYSNYDVEPAGARLRIIPKKSGLEEYFADLGVTIENSMLLEPKEHAGLPFLINVLGRQVNLDGFVLQRSGNLSVPYASPIDVDVNKLKKNGYESDTMIFSTEQAWSLPYAPKGEVIDRAALSPKGAKDTNVENIGIVLTSDKAWEGRLFLYSSRYIFSDSSPGANQLYLKNILMTFEKADRINSLHTTRDERPALKPLDAGTRILWRAVVVFLLPGVLFALLLSKLARAQHLNLALRRFDMTFLSLCAVVAAALFVTFLLLRPLGRLSVDVTREKVNSLNPRTLDWMGRLPADVTVRYFTSPSSDMPLSSKGMLKDTITRLRTIEKAGNGRVRLVVETVGQDGSGDAALQQRLARYGIKPFKMRMIENDRYVEKMVYSGLVFETGGRFEAVPVLSRQNTDRIEFVTVAALKRLIEQKRPTVAFLADLPHLSAGEFWEQQQLEMQIQPKSSDAYARLLEFLKNEGYDVHVYDARTTNTTFSEDLLIYIQPWVITDHVKSEITRMLASGKSVMLAVQHYYMQARKYSGRAYEVVYWPQPQFSRINELLAPYGIELVQELFLDQSKAPIETREQIRWGAYKKQDKRAPDAQPFIIRAIPSNFDRESPITARLSDLLFIWGSRWRVLKDTFSPSLEWHPLILSSEDCWGYNWTGGFIAPETLQKGDYLDVKQPLCVMVKGKFPGATDKEGKLLLIGSSKLMENEQLETTRYDHEKFILNAVADLAYGTELARIQAGGKPSSRGFPFVEPGQKLLWRFFAILFVPLLLAFYGVVRHRRYAAKANARRVRQ